MLFQDLLVLSDIVLYLLQVVVGAIFIYHALPKVRNPKAMAQGIGFPAGAVAMLGTVELVSGLALVFGVFAQVAAILLSIVMLGAIYFKMAKWKVPFSAQDKTGWEFDLVLLASNILILTTGGGSIGF